MGTEDNQMIYILTTRSEIDMIDIKEEFAARFETALASKIKVGDDVNTLINSQKLYLRIQTPMFRFQTSYTMIVEMSTS